jgi:hypothetical protein
MQCHLDCGTYHWEYSGLMASFDGLVLFPRAGFPIMTGGVVSPTRGCLVACLLLSRLAGSWITAKPCRLEVAGKVCCPAELVPGVAAA